MLKTIILSLTLLSAMPLAAQQEIPADIFQGKVGREIDVLVDEIDQENDEAIAR